MATIDPMTAVTNGTALGIRPNILVPAMQRCDGASEPPIERLIATVSRYGGIATFFLVVGTLSYLIL